LVLKLAGRVKPPVGAVPVMLLRWDYIATMTYNYHEDAPVAKARIGFTRA